MDSPPRDPLSVLLPAFAEQSHAVAVILLDARGHIAWWGKGAERIFGYESAEVIGKDPAFLFTPEDRERRSQEQEVAVAVAHGAAEDDRWQLRRDGSRFFANGVLTTVRNAEGSVAGFVKLLRDRSDMREQLEALRNQVAELVNASTRKDVFLATLSHELRNPLAPLTTAVGLIRLASPPQAEVDHALKVIERQTALLKRLVDDLLDVTRVGAGKVLLSFAPLDLREVVANSVTANTPAGARHPEVHLLQPEAPMPVKGDRDRLQQIFGNLLGNALKFTPPEGEIYVKSTMEADEAVVRVEDSGVGIAPDMLPRIFELFTQAEETRSLSPGGLGIGLALVKDLVGLHGGSVQVRSEGLGKGSEFTVRLPLLREAQDRGMAPGGASG